MSRQSKGILFNKKLWSVIILLLFIVFVVFYVVHNWSEFERLELKNPEFLMLMALMALIHLYGNGRSMDAALHPLGLRLNRFETLGLASITGLGNYIAPGKMGLAIRATYLKRKYELPLTQFASSLAAAQLLTFFFSSVLGLGAIIILWRNMSVPELIPFAFLLAGITAGLTCTFLFFPRIKERNNRLYNHLAKAINGFHTIRHKQSTLLNIGLWTIVKIASQALVIYAAFRAFGAEITFIESLFIFSINVFNTVIGITPAGFGIGESLIVVSASAVGLPVSLALSAALLRRIVALAVVFVATLFSSHKLFGKSIFQVMSFRRKEKEIDTDY